MMGQSQILSAERERQLMELIRRGDRGALGELLLAYHRRLHHLCMRMVGRGEEAADLTQDVLLRAVQHIDEFKSESRVSTWLFRIAMNLAISHLRKLKLRRTASIDAEGPEGARMEPVAHRELSPHQSVELKEQTLRLDRAIEGLEPDLKSVLLLRDIQDMEYLQMADVLGLPVGTVKSRLFRARLALRQAMEAQLRPSEVADG
jgi:RNA polymerase sigma-70 factor (ECF subfamily)